MIEADNKKKMMSFFGDNIKDGKQYELPKDEFPMPGAKKAVHFGFQNMFKTIPRQIKKDALQHSFQIINNMCFNICLEPLSNGFNGLKFST